MRLDGALKDGTNHIEECILLRFRKPTFSRSFGRFSGRPTVRVLYICLGSPERSDVKMDINSVWNIVPLMGPHGELLSSY